MPKEELLFLWKISFALLGFGSGKRPVKFEGDEFNLTPTSGPGNKEPGDTERTTLCGGNRLGVTEDEPQSLTNPKESGCSNDGTCGGADEKCMELVAGPEINWGVACLQYEVAFEGFIPDFAAACWNIAIAAWFDMPEGNLPTEELNAPLSCCCL